MISFFKYILNTTQTLTLFKRYSKHFYEYLIKIKIYLPKYFTRVKNKKHLYIIGHSVICTHVCFRICKKVFFFFSSSICILFNYTPKIGWMQLRHTYSWDIIVCVVLGWFYLDLLTKCLLFTLWVSKTLLILLCNLNFGILNILGRVGSITC